MLKGHVKYLYALIAVLLVAFFFHVYSEEDKLGGLMTKVSNLADITTIFGGSQTRQENSDFSVKQNDDGNGSETPEEEDEEEWEEGGEEETQAGYGETTHTYEVTEENDNKDSLPSSNQEMAIVSNGLHPDVKIVPSTPAKNLRLPYRDCIPLPEAPKKGVQICIYPTEKDRGVSGTLKKNVLWERELIKRMESMLQSDTSLMLFDIGMNIGEYALWAAAMGRQVVAVEMLMNNINMVQTALDLSGLTEMVTIVNNALYKDHRTLETTFIVGSVGANRLNTTKIFRKKDEKAEKVLVKTICIDDLIPLMKGRNVYIKMDIENSEHTALMCAHRFFKEINVKVVQMEWHRRIPEESMAKHEPGSND